MSYISVNQVQSYNFSPENKYSQEYYNAYQQLVDAKYKLTNTEPSSPDEAKKLEKIFDYWKKQTPKIAMKAKAEENKLEPQGVNEQNGMLGQKIDYMA